MGGNNRSHQGAREEVVEGVGVEVGEAPSRIQAAGKESAGLSRSAEAEIIERENTKSVCRSGFVTSTMTFVHDSGATV